jgi:hypothetical protein
VLGAARALRSRQADTQFRRFEAKLGPIEPLCFQYMATGSATERCIAEPKWTFPNDIGQLPLRSIPAFPLERLWPGWLLPAWTSGEPEWGMGAASSPTAAGRPEVHRCFTLTSTSVFRLVSTTVSRSASFWTVTEERLISTHHLRQRPLRKAACNSMRGTRRVGPLQPWRLAPSTLYLASQQVAATPHPQFIQHCTRETSPANASQRVTVAPLFHGASVRREESHRAGRRVNGDEDSHPAKARWCSRLKRASS